MEVMVTKMLGIRHSIAKIKYIGLMESFSPSRKERLIMDGSNLLAKVIKCFAGFMCSFSFEVLLWKYVVQRRVDIFTLQAILGNSSSATDVYCVTAVVLIGVMVVFVCVSSRDHSYDGDLR